MRSAITEINKTQKSDLQEAISFEDSRQRLCKGISSKLNNFQNSTSVLKQYCVTKIFSCYFTKSYLRVTVIRSGTKKQGLPGFWRSLLPVSNAFRMVRDDPFTGDSCCKNRKIFDWYELIFGNCRKGCHFNNFKTMI